MKEQDYKASLTVSLPAHEVFENINNVGLWWTDDLKGHSQKLNDEFTVHFGEVHVSTQRLIEIIPDQKIVWLVTYSDLNFIKQRDEWTGTTIIFEISQKSNKTQIDFTHHGLDPTIECFKGCSQGWDYYFKESLFKLLTEGKGTPGL